MYSDFITSVLSEIKDYCNSKDVCIKCKFHYLTDNDLRCLFETITPSEWNIEAIRRNFYDL